MAKVHPFHTETPEYPPDHREVYHDHDNCFEGQKIKPEHRLRGDGGKKRCLICVRLG